MIDFACKKFDIKEIIKCSLNLSRSDFSIMLKLFSYKDFLSSKEISDKVSLDITTVQRTLKKLYEKGIINRKQINLETGGYAYIYKIKSKDELKNQITEIIEKWSETVKKEINNW